MSYYYPPQGHHYPPPPVPPRPKTSDGKILAIIFGVLAFFLVSGALGVLLMFFVFKEGVGMAFGECSTTPQVTSVALDTATVQGYDLFALEYKCDRDETATVRSDTAEAYLAIDTEYTNSADMISDLKDIYLAAKWTSVTEGVAKDGYTITLEPHSYDPALIKLTVSRDTLGGKNPWDGVRKASFPER